MADFLAPNPGVVGGAAGAVSVGLLLWTVRRAAASEGDTAVLAYGRALRGVVVVFWLFWLGLVGVLVVHPGDDPRGMAGVVVGFFALNLLQHAEYFGVRVTFDEAGIRTRSPWRAGRHIPWSAARRAWYSGGARWHVIETERQGRVRLHDFLRGVDSLLAELRRRGVPVESPRRAEPGTAADRKG